ncbi:N-acetyldiaminopimelate deacetylase [Shouchella lonarensis]|uniref:N-acetyldiaminopimelate deacetylase n=1 Tax=Shouchella lonarensis TaxID=1464122 RepID=A0A1G6IT93_9BACI|nr:N-acetyldiaminopimelate deacetylase [Shouchella lonarensis]SDC08986.1 N-acetyldiaminopimelate deacetylase [Shouchella lonarensis]
MDWNKLRRAFHRIPELGFCEVKTQQLILDTIANMRQTRLTVQTWKTGVIVRVRGKSAYTVAYRADMDGLPLSEETGYEFASIHKGTMHACGHDFHMTIALGILAHFSEVEPPCQLVFIFQPAEEGPGGAKPMLEEGVLKDCWPDEMYALHIDPTLPVGTVSTKPGLLFAHTSELFIDFHGQGGHAAYPHKANDMVVAAAHFVTQLQTIVARNIDPLSSAVVTIGVIQGGTKQNVIAETARIEGTIRTLSEEAMETVKSRIVALTKGIEAAFECKMMIDYGANYCGVHNDATLVSDFRSFTESAAQMTYHEATEAMTGEDFGYFLNEIPGLMFWLGVDSPYGLHDVRLAPKEEAIEVAIRHMTGFLELRGK